MKSIYSTAALLLVIAAPLQVLAQNNVAWSTVVNYVVETKLPDGTGYALGSNPEAAANNAPANPQPVAAQEKNVVNQAPASSPSSTSTTTSSTPSSTPPSSTPSPAAASSPPPAASPSPSPPTANVDNTARSAQSCSGPGMNIAWTGDQVSYTVGSTGATGTTTGCLNLGTDFSSHVEVGGAGGTWFEGNYATGNPQWFDVSFITGFSVPMVCSGSEGHMSGCSIDLFSQGNACPQPNGNVCHNPTGVYGSKDPGGYQGDMTATPWCYACSAPDPFFQPCAGSGYTYPYDDGATQTTTGTITCCIGTSCGTTGREGSKKAGNPQPTRDPPCNLCPSGGSKRGLDEVFDSFEKQQRAVSPSMLPRKHKRHVHHRHAALHEHAT
ncbi:hypothetical protein OEA41_005366 [Lepraria neglecta]|uniref:Uncharacterized protein n=1 Tax=Lepraria neglecta TaxID=209136 RepID=A0AAD9Z1M8_9LECA|nr:hypothetical protein OEA41_005366 [Lepraria neglecta]